MTLDATTGALATTAPSATVDEELDPRRWLALAVISVAQLMVVLDASIVTIALPAAQRALHISVANRQWVVTAYTLAFGGLLLLGGRIADFMGRKRIFVVGLVGFALSSALGGAAADAPMLFAARALQGAFGALMAPAALSLISVTFSKPKERATAFGVYGAIAGGGAAIGLILGGVLTDYASWRWCLLVNAPISVLTAILALRIVRESRAHGDTRYDVPGALTATGGLASLVYGFTRATSDGWGAPGTLVFLGVAVVLLAAFVVVETRTTHPLLPVRVLADRNRAGSFLASLLAGMATLGVFLFLTFYMQGILHYSPLRTGFAFLPFSGGIVLGAALASRILPRIGPRPMMTGGFLAAALGMVWLTQLGVHTGFATHILPSEIVMSVGFGMVFVPMSSTALFGVDTHDAGVASATLNTSQQVGGSLGTALLNTLYANAAAAFLVVHGHSLADQLAAQVHGFAVGYQVSTALLVVAAVVSVLFVAAPRSHLVSPGSEVALILD